jgi:hypothetical protein
VAELLLFFASAFALFAPSRLIPGIRIEDRYIRTATTRKPM